MRIVVYDLETKNSPVTKADWTNWPWLGISVGCAYDFKTEEYSVYLDDNLPALIDLLNSADLVAAFNHISFDNNLLAGTPISIAGDKKLAIKQNYDMLVESRAGAGVDMYTKGFKLDAHLRATLGPAAMKTGDGAFAPDLYKAGKQGELISYCLADVHRERLLFEHVWNAGNLGCEHNGGSMHAVRRPQELLGLEMSTRLTDVRNIFPRIGGGPHIIGVDPAKPGEDRTVEVTVCFICHHIHDNGTPHISIEPKPVDSTNPEDL